MYAFQVVQELFIILKNKKIKKKSIIFRKEL